MVVTKITARHITKVVAMLMVTAKAEQIPNTCNAIGLLLKIGSISTSFCVAISAAPQRLPAFAAVSYTHLTLPTKA